MPQEQEQDTNRERLQAISKLLEEGTLAQVERELHSLTSTTTCARA